mmetsp:Transcript_46050/g.121584  ORF Transcript_46050/g.121584 Transcript_46050/m.121584 type:complete len:197 (-) Transcript_46050:105-695(-)
MPHFHYFFDRVVLAPGAAVGAALLRIDPALSSASGVQILPVFGSAVVSEGGVWLDRKHRAIGVTFEEEKQYVRATQNGGVAIGGGMYFGDVLDEKVRALQYDSGGGFDGDDFFSHTELGRQVVNDPDTLRLGGVRPLGPFGYFPTLKSYWNGRVVLNTGGGVNGYVSSWKAGELAADIALHSTTKDERWKFAFTDV